ncbi:MAG: glycerophosphoryl diester phosphodiesterase [Chloroflexota bacterium]|jgi:glycerophosphoryl diester phosphodiesterase|nr:glycerophosphoryl diester phosphodiesterase [Chloroflexota bacterium]
MERSPERTPLAIHAERPRPQTPIGFAHRGGGTSRAGQNTLPAFARAAARGSGIESDVWLTADGVPVLLHASLLHRRRPVRTLVRRELPSYVPTLDELYARCGAGFDLALDMADPRAAEEVVRSAARHGAVHRLWLTYWRTAMLAEWRRRWPEVRLVYPTLLIGSARRSTALLDRLAAIDVDAVNVLHHRLGAGTVAAAHRRGLIVFAWGVRRRSGIERALRRGADGVFADDVGALVAAVEHAQASPGG